MSFVVDIILSFVWKYILMPVVFVVSAPFIIIISLFKKGNLVSNVKLLLAKVHTFWMERGDIFAP